MFSKLFISLFTILQSQEIQTSTIELAQIKRENNLAQLVSLLSIFALTLAILLIIYVVKNYKLKAEIKSLKKQ